jgi:4-hydroxybenzoate polyprenyltransferase
MPLDLLRLARPSQWVKNGIVMAAVVFAGDISNPAKVELALAAMGVFCLLSSAVYVLNDIVDRDKDKIHPLKKDRPIASGKVPVPLAFVFLAILAIAGFGGALLINKTLLSFGIAFVAVNLAYSLVLKNIVILDVMALAFSFVIRAYAGAAAVDVAASKWLLINTLLLALFLGLGKRRHELVLLDESAVAHRKSLSNYSPYLLDQLIGVTTASVVVMYMLYSFSDEVSAKLGTQNLYVTIPFVVYGIFRYLYLIHRKSEGGSPTRVLYTDIPIMVTVILWMATVLIVLYHINWRL